MGLVVVPRQRNAWCAVWRDKLFDLVEPHGGGLYTVPSRSRPDEHHAVQYWPLAPDGYIYTCSCPASELGGVVCRHMFAVYLWRLVYKFDWRIKPPEGG